MHFALPLPIQQILTLLQQSGYSAEAVGGCVRDSLLRRIPKDWDITTNAHPEQIQALFPDSVYENTFGTVGIKVPRPESTEEVSVYDIVEVTTYRVEGDYTDSRHPDRVQFVGELKQDLSRRDFTINAMALDWKSEGESTVIDYFGGRSDLDAKVIRAVGDPVERFTEDALRMLRAIRFAVYLGDTGASGKSEQTDWKIEKGTWEAIQKLAPTLANISAERIRDEFSKIILSPYPMHGVLLLEDAGLLQYIIPELREGIGITQNLHHIYTVWEHNLRALHTCPSDKLEVRLATLLHDVAKPRTKKGDGYRSTFYNHDHVGARMTRKILDRLRYSRKIADHAALLVDNHLFYYNVGEVTEASVRRLLSRVGRENMDDLMAVRIGDRLGSGVPKAKPYKLRHLEYMVDKVSTDAVSVKMLKISGVDLKEKLGIAPGPIYGAILDVLLAEVIDDAAKNTPEHLLQRAEELKDESPESLRALAKKRIEEEREKDLKEIKSKHWVE